MFLPNSDHEWPSKRSGTSACRSVKKCREKYLLQINISKYFIGKNKQNFVFFVSFFFRFFFFSLHISNLDQPLASVVLPTIPQSFVMICFTMLGSQIDLYFWNRMPDYFASARRAYKSPACRNLRIYTLLLLWPDTGQHRSSTKILISRRRQKKLNCLSSY